MDLGSEEALADALKGVVAGFLKPGMRGREQSEAQQNALLAIAGSHPESIGPIDSSSLRMD